MRNDSVFPRPHVAAGVVVLILLSAFARASRAQELFTIQQVDGRLSLLPRALTAEQAAAADGRRSNLRCWHCGQGGVEFEDYDPHGYFDGSIYVRSNGDTLELGGRRQNFHDWEIIDFSLAQAPQEVTALYTVRTPINMPDVTFKISERNLTLLLIRHPEVKAMLDAVLTASGEEAGFGFDPAVLAQVAPCHWEEPEGVAEKVAALLPKLASNDWRERDRAEQALVALGRDGALFLLLRLDRHALSAQQNLGIDHVVSRYPLLSVGDRELCRQDPSRLATTAPQAPQLGRTE